MFPGLQVVAQPAARVGGDEAGIEAVEPAGEARPDDLQVTRLAEHLAEPPELLLEILGAGDDPFERLERAAQAAAGDPGLVDGVLLGQPHVRVLRDQRVGVGAEVGDDDLADRTGLGPDPRRRRGDAVSQDAGEFARAVRGSGAGLAQPLGDLLKEAAIALLELGLDLAPAPHHRLVPEHGALHAVVGDLHKDRALRATRAPGATRAACAVRAALAAHAARAACATGAEQPGDAAAGLQPGHRRERGAPRVREDEARQLGGHHLGAAGERPGDLLAGSLGLGQLEVPALVVPAAPPAQSDAASRQPQIGGVEIDRGQAVGERLGHPLAPRHAAEVGQGETLRNVELVLDLQRHRSPRMPRFTVICPPR